MAGTILRYNMLSRGHKVGVAVSGGADSMCLLAVLAELAAAEDWRLTVLHLNHGLRGAESDADAAFVRAAARRAGLDCETSRLPRGRLAGPNLEEKSREARYRFFTQMAKKHRLDCIATAHTLNDQAETVMLRLLRGAGPSGLAGIAPAVRTGYGVAVVRPLIEIERPDIEAWLGERGLAWREDSSNASLEFDRNRVRHQLLPMLGREFNPAVTRLLGRVAELCAVEERFWNRWAGPALAAATTSQGHGVLVLDTERVAQLDQAEQRRLLRAAVEQAKGDLRQFDHAHVEKLAGLCAPGRGTGSARLPGIEATRSFDRLRIAVPAPTPKEFSVTVPRAGRWVAIPGSRGWRIRLQPVPGGASTGYNTDAGSVSVPLGPPWVVRSWKPGDAYRPTGYQRSYKLKELFQAAKVPSWERPGWPIIINVTNGRILWSRRFGWAAEASSALVVDESGSGNE